MARSRSAASKAGWYKRWRSGKNVGPKGTRYLKGVARREKRKQAREPKRYSLDVESGSTPQRWRIEDPVRRTGKKKK